MGPEGSNVLFDTWVHPLMMGLEEHLLTMFREDFEFHDDATPSHLGASSPGRPDQGSKAAHEMGIGEAPAAPPLPAPAAVTPHAAAGDPLVWGADAEKELRKIPFFVRGKARRNTERFAAERGIATITLETLYDAKAHYAR
jgi:light-independent protochlorophyllide reductase subunit B